MLEVINQALIDFLVIPDKAWSFCSFSFLLAFIFFYSLYILSHFTWRKVRLAYVILFSFFFAWKVNGILMVLLPLTAVATWWMTRMMMTARQHRQLILAVIIVIILSPLIFFKYGNFIIGTVNELTATNFPLTSVIVPVGISFYTFQAISYSVDVYKKRYARNTTLLDYTFYLTFFPLLLAGPITRAEVLLPQLKRRRNIDTTLVYKGLWLIMLGLLKKGLIADYIAEFNNWVFDDPTAYSGFENLMAVFGYTLQIYCDFSGYSDMAIGLAALMGYELKDNFRFPYQSLNPTEFWHRWHIALSTWFRDYLYIPLGGNRHGELRTMLNNFVTMLVAGLWHGASWMFVLWGAIHGIALVVHKTAKRAFLDSIPNTPVVKAVSWALTFLFISFTWIFFRAADFQTAGAILTRITTDMDLSLFVPFLQARPVWLLFVTLGLELHSIRESDYHWMESQFIRMPWFVKLFFFVVVVQLIINFRQDFIQPFIYTQF